MSFSATAQNNEVVIQVNNVSKCYRCYKKPTHQLWQNFFPNRQFFDEIHALESVNLTVKKAETVGIVGKNGSGKSTLLQIITGVLQASSGEIATKGRISALLELGAGFNPEFTGMENARLNASIMGLSREEFHQKLPDIVDFCGLGDFLHRPVKTYSSGMFVRLAFAVAINMNPDILIIDEALAVGDVRFQRKCFRRLEQLKETGVSILFVTHSTDSVLKYCDSAILLNEGKLIDEGSPKQVVQTYLEMMFQNDTEIKKEVPPSDEIVTKHLDADFNPLLDNCVQQAGYNENEHRWGDGRAKICDYQLYAQSKKNSGVVQRGDAIVLKMYVHFSQDINELIYGLTVKTADGQIVYGTNSRISAKVPSSQQAGDVVVLEFDLDVNLLGGDYFISLGVAQDDDSKDNIAIDRRYDLIHICVTQTKEAFGTADLCAKIRYIDDLSTT